MKMKMKATKFELNESCKSKPKLTLEAKPAVAGNHISTLKLDFEW